MGSLVDQKQELRISGVARRAVFPSAFLVKGKL